MNISALFPIYLPEKQIDKVQEKNFLVISLRRKTSNFAKYTFAGDEIRKELEKKYEAKDYSSCIEMINAFIQDFNITDYDGIAIAVPGPVIHHKCITTNLPWVVDKEEIKNHFGVDKVLLINDLEAVSYSLPRTKPETLKILHDSENKLNGNMAILSIGKGLGEAGLFWDGALLRPFATEGGHTEFSPRNDYEVQFYQFINKIYGIVTWETVLSEKGIYDIYRFLRDIGRHQEDEEFTQRIQNENFLDVLVDFASQKNCTLVNMTVEMYAEFLAREATNLALKLKSVGGLIITGNIPNKLFGLMDLKAFHKKFLVSDKMQNLLSDVPIYWLNTNESILEGCANYAASV